MRCFFNCHYLFIICTCSYWVASWLFCIIIWVDILMCVCSFLCEFILLYWKTNQTVTRQVPANIIATLMHYPCLVCSKYITCVFFERGCCQLELRLWCQKGTIWEPWMWKCLQCQWDIYLAQLWTQCGYFLMFYVATTSSNASYTLRLWLLQTNEYYFSNQSVWHFSQFYNIQSHIFPQGNNYCNLHRNASYVAIWLGDHVIVAFILLV